MASRALRRRSTYRALNGHKKSTARPILRIGLVLLVGFMMLTSGASAMTLLFYGQDLPSLQAFKKGIEFQDTIIRDRFGHVLYDLADVSKKDRGRRVVEPIIDPSHPTSYYKSTSQYWLTGADIQPGKTAAEGIPLLIQNATIATEDSSFYSNFGFDPVSIARAAYDDLTKGQVVSGASTITQQLIKRFLLTPSPTLSRKAEEIILAAELTQKYSKSKILWYYLNSVYYGNQSLGVQAAAQTYFHTDVWNLDLAESAMLAGLPEAPSIYDPVNNLSAAKARMSYVLHLMYVHGYLKDKYGHPDPSQVTAALHEANTSPKFRNFQPPINSMVFPHFVRYVIDWIQGLHNPNIDVTKGLDITTTIDPRLQLDAQSIVKDQIAGLGPQNVTDGALVSIDMKPDCYGCILAMVGSADYGNKAISGEINMADTPRQPGSSFKPFNYVTAFENGLSPATQVLDGPLAIPDVGNPDDGGWYQPQNYDHLWHGTVSLRVALQNSLNIPAVKVEQYNANGDVGNVRNTIAQTAYKMGITSLFQDNQTCCGWAFTLGGMEHGVRLVEETSAFGAFGAQGNKVPAIPILSVRDRTTGKELLNLHDLDSPRQQVLKPQYAYEMTNVLSDNSSRCTPVVCEFDPNSPLNLGRPAAAKTGTTNSFTDNWTVGYTPYVVTGVWVGNADNSPMQNTTGVTGAAPIWNAFMQKVDSLYNLPPDGFTQPSGISFGSTCESNGPSGTGYLTTSYDIFVNLQSTTLPICYVGGATADSLPSQAPTVPQQQPVPPAQPAPAPVQPQTQPTPPSQPIQPVATTAPAPVVQPTAVPAQQPIGTTQQPPVQQPVATAVPAQQPPSSQTPGQPIQPAPPGH